MAYSSTLMRWMQTDPTGAEYVDGPNTYQFVGNSPVGALDSTGLYTITFEGGTAFTAAEQKMITDAITDSAKTRFHALRDDTAQEIWRWENSPCKAEMKDVLKELENLLAIVDKAKAGIASKDKLHIETEDLPRNPDRQLAQYTGPFGGLYLRFNKSGKPGWRKMSENEFRSSIFHELTHIYDTVDNDSKGVLINAHNFGSLVSVNTLYHEPLLLHGRYAVLVRKALLGTRFFAAEWRKFMEAQDELKSARNGHLPTPDSRGNR